MRKFDFCKECTDLKEQFFNCSNCKLAKDRDEKDKRVSKKSN